MLYVIVLSINFFFALGTFIIIHQKSNSDVLTDSPLLLNSLLFICTPFAYRGMYGFLDLVTHDIDRVIVSLTSIIFFCLLYRYLFIVLSVINQTDRLGS